MSLGEGIFASALVLAVVALYIGTKDRWKWRKLIKWAIGLPVALICVSSLAYWGYWNYSNRLQQQTALLGISMTDTPDDVKLKKGMPDSYGDDNQDKQMWIYFSPATEKQGALLVRFIGSKVRYVSWVDPFNTADSWNKPNMQRISIGTSYESLIQTLGQPSHGSTGKDGLSRTLSYEKWNTFYEVIKGKVVAMGIYDPKEGPITYRTPPQPDKQDGK